MLCFVQGHAVSSQIVSGSLLQESGSFDKSANSKDSHSQGKGHRRSRSATFVKELFTGRRSRSGKEDSSKGDEV